MKWKKIQWHPGFASAIDMEFRKQRKNLVYHKEYNLGTKPFQIDLLVVKKDPYIQMENEIGKIFRKYNIMEYKSPDDHLDIDAFYKAEGYGCFYKAFGKYSDERPADDITVTIVRDTKPEGLFKYFREHNIRMENPFPGVYYIGSSFLFQTQVIVGRELNPKEHTWIKALSNNVRKDEMKELLEKTNSLKGKYEKELAESILEVCLKANNQVANELRGGDSVTDGLLEFLQPDIDRIVKEKVKLVNEKEKKRWVRRFIADGEISLKKLSKIMDMPMKDVVELARSQPASGKNKRLKSETQKKAGKICTRDERIR